MGFIIDDYLKYARDELLNEKKQRDTSRIWAKVMRRDKIMRDCMYKLPEPFDPEHLFKYVSEIAKILDIPTPIILKSHENSFKEFNTVRFKANEFVEKINFDSLMLESAAVEEEAKHTVKKTRNYQ